MLTYMPVPFGASILAGVLRHSTRVDSHQPVYSLVLFQDGYYSRIKVGGEDT